MGSEWHLCPAGALRVLGCHLPPWTQPSAPAPGVGAIGGAQGVRGASALRGDEERRRGGLSPKTKFTAGEGGQLACSSPPHPLLSQIWTSVPYLASYVSPVLKENKAIPLSPHSLEVLCNGKQSAERGFARGRRPRPG